LSLIAAFFAGLLQFVLACFLGAVWVTVLFPGVLFVLLLVLAIVAQGGIRALLMSTYFGLCVISYAFAMLAGLIGIFSEEKQLPTSFGLLLGASAAMWGTWHVRSHGGWQYIRREIRHWRMRRARS